MSSSRSPRLTRFRTPQRALRTILMFVAAAAFARSTLAGFSFTPLGDLSGGKVAAFANDISADGSVVIGRASTGRNTFGPGDRGFTWTAEDGLQVITADRPEGRDAVLVYAISPDATKIVGQSTLGDAYQWTASGTGVSLGQLPGSSSRYGSGHGISVDGSVIVGSAQTSFGTWQAFRWTEATGMVAIGNLPGQSFFSYGNDVDESGSVMVGVMGFATESAITGSAFRWTAAEGMQSLGVLEGGRYYSEARSISADGSVIVGYSGSSLGDQAFRWTDQDGMIGLGSLPGKTTSQANAISADGSTIVGYSSDSLGQYATMWLSDGRVIDLQKYLVENGVANLDGWRLRFALGSSADGTTIVGSGIDPEGTIRAFVATVAVPEATSLTLVGMGLSFLVVSVLRKNRIQVW